MKMLFILGQCIGLNPVTGILQKDASKIRFTVYSGKFIFSLIMAIVQVVVIGLCAYHLFKGSISISGLGFITFFMTTTCITFSFIRVATKWPTLMKELINSRLDEYVCPNIIKKCNIACYLFFVMAVLEHIMSVLSRYARLMDCSVNITDFGQAYVTGAAPWLYELDVPYIPVVGVVVQSFTLTATAIWNYADIFIVCVSLYLTSILDQINKRIILTANKNYLPTSIWGVLREDYTRATRLVRLFDDVFSFVILVIFANDLFFICLQLYNVLAKGITSVQAYKKICPRYPSGLLQGYEYSMYLTYSTLYLFVRFLTVSIVSSGVHTASLVPASVLYTVPTTAYTKEVDRFLNQVNGDVIALSGLKFFYITRELVLSVAGTIVTYELVLLQLSSDELNSS